MTRLRDWQERLEALFASRIDAPFAWGVNDCCLFAADAVFAMTGIDHAASWRGQYAEERGALRLMHDLGGLAAIATIASTQEVHPLRAGVGDLVLGRIDRDCLGICGGATWHAPSSQGLVAAPMTKALRAWRVGHA